MYSSYKNAKREIILLEIIVLDSITPKLTNHTGQKESFSLVILAGDPAGTDKLYP